MKQTLQAQIRTWLYDAYAIYRQKPVLVIALLGFSAGLPYLLVFSTLTAWLRDVGVERTTIGFFAWVGITYSIKVFWSPVVDRVRLPMSKHFGQRRSWILLGQVGIATGLILMSVVDPINSLIVIAVAALLVAFSSATQDVALDAFRIESAAEELQGAMSAADIFGYRLALLMAGAGALYIAEFSNSTIAYLSMAVLMLIGVFAIFWADEPERASVEERNEIELELVDKIMGRPMNMASRSPWQRWLYGAVICPY